MHIDSKNNIYQDDNIDIMIEIFEDDVEIYSNYIINKLNRILNLIFLLSFVIYGIIMLGTNMYTSSSPLSYYASLTMLSLMILTLPGYYMLILRELRYFATGIKHRIYPYAFSVLLLSLFNAVMLVFYYISSNGTFFLIMVLLYILFIVMKAYLRYRKKYEDIDNEVKETILEYTEQLKS